MRDTKLYLKDIFDAIVSIENFVQNMSFDEFEQDDKTVSAVIRKFEIIGEATKQVPEEIKKEFPQIPWKEMAGMRDRLIHFYFGVDYPLVWKAIKERIPLVKASINRIVEQKEWS